MIAEATQTSSDSSTTMYNLIGYAYKMCIL